MEAVVLHSESQSTLVYTSLFEVPIAMSHWSGTWLLLNPQYRALKELFLNILLLSCVIAVLWL